MLLSLKAILVWGRMLSLRLCLPSFLLEVLAAGLGGLVIIFAIRRVVAGAGRALIVVNAACSHSSCQEGFAMMKMREIGSMNTSSMIGKQQTVKQHDEMN